MILDPSFIHFFLFFTPYSYSLYPLLHIHIRETYCYRQGAGFSSEMPLERRNGQVQNVKCGFLASILTCGSIGPKARDFHEKLGRLQGRLQAVGVS